MFFVVVYFLFNCFDIVYVLSDSFFYSYAKLFIWICLFVRLAVRPYVCPSVLQPVWSAVVLTYSTFCFVLYPNGLPEVHDCHTFCPNPIPAKPIQSTIYSVPSHSPHHPLISVIFDFSNFEFNDHKFIDFMFIFCFDASFLFLFLILLCF